MSERQERKFKSKIKKPSCDTNTPGAKETLGNVNSGKTADSSIGISPRAHLPVDVEGKS
jgi:hypothetical protein